MAGTPSKSGRKPRAANQGQRPSLGLKVTPDIKNRLDAAAKANGRTQSQEAEVRLEQSFQRQDMLAQALELAYGRQVAGIIFGVAHVIGREGRAAMVLSRAKPDSSIDAWFDDAWSFERVINAATGFLNALRPPGDPKSPSPEAEAYADQGKMLIDAIKDADRMNKIPAEGRSSILDAIATEDRALLGGLADRLKGETK